jgi:hypothetical protein
MHCDSTVHLYLVEERDHYFIGVHLYLVEERDHYFIGFIGSYLFWDKTV